MLKQNLGEQTKLIMRMNKWKMGFSKNIDVLPDGTPVARLEIFGVKGIDHNSGTHM